MVTLQIHDEGLIEQLQQLATQENQTIEAVLQMLVGQYMHRQAAFEAMDGMFDDDIHDLSTSIRDTMHTYYQGRDGDSR